MAEEVAMRTNLHSFTATERGAVARKREERGERAPAGRDNQSGTMHDQVEDASLLWRSFKA